MPTLPNRKQIDSSIQVSIILSSLAPAILYTVLSRSTYQEFIEKFRLPLLYSLLVTFVTWCQFADKACPSWIDHTKATRPYSGIGRDSCIAKNITTTSGMAHRVLVGTGNDHER